MATLTDWIVMCAETPELVANFNRLYGRNLSFEPLKRSPIEAMVDKACDYVPLPQNSPEDMRAFFDFCADVFWRKGFHTPTEEAANARA